MYLGWRRRREVREPGLSVGWLYRAMVRLRRSSTSIVRLRRIQLPSCAQHHAMRRCTVIQIQHNQHPTSQNKICFIIINDRWKCENDFQYLKASSSIDDTRYFLVLIWYRSIEESPDINNKLMIFIAKIIN